MFLRTGTAPLLGALGLGVAFVATCTHCSGVSTNASEDASVLDAAFDARRPRDAQTVMEEDADTRDADSFDRSWLPGDWDPPPGTWPRCHQLIARNPERDVTPLRWRPCPSGRAGCRMSTSDWDPSSTQSTLNTSGGEPVQVDSLGRPYLVHTREYPSTFQGGANHIMRVVERLDDVPIAAIAMMMPATSECGGYMRLHRGGMVTHLLSENPAATEHLLWSTFETPRQYISKVSVLRSQTAGGGAGIYGLNAESALLLNADVGQWFIANRSTGALVQPFESTTVPALDQARSLPNGYLARKLAGNFPIMRVWNDGHMALLLDTAEAGRFVIGYDTDIVNPTQLVWVEATGLYAPRTSPVIYTATLTDSGAALVPRRLTAYPDPDGLGGAYFMVANGMALVRTSKTTAELVRISDGQHWSIAAESGMGFRDPLWVSTSELWIHTANYYPSNGVVTNNDAILRLRIDTLGPGSPAQ